MQRLSQLNRGWIGGRASSRPGGRRLGAAWLFGAGVLLAAVSPSAMAQEQVILGEDGWVVAGTLDPTTPDGQLAIAKRQFALGKHEVAVDAVDDWLEVYPNHPLAAEAYLLRADAKVGNGDTYDGLFDYEYVVRVYPGSEQFNMALEREHAIALAYLNGEKRKLWGMKILGAAAEGAEILIRIQERAPGTALAEQSMLALADYYYREGEMFLASEMYDLLLMNYPNSRHKRYATLRLILTNLGQYKGPRYDVTTLLDANQWLEKYETDFPASSLALGVEAFGQRIDEAMARKQLDTAKWYLRRGEKVSAVHVLNGVVTDHPATASALEALDILTDLGPVPGVDSLVPGVAAGEDLSSASTNTTAQSATDGQTP